MEKKKILVAGGAGFIGFHLCKKLLKDGHTVICLDNLSTGSKQNLNDYARHQNFKFIKQDITHMHSNLQSALNLEPQTLSVDVVYHLASPASISYISQHPIETALANSIGTQNLLELARKHNARFLFASSSEVYGDPQQHPQPESYWGNVNPSGLRSPYDEGKRFSEALCMAYQRSHKLAVKIARIFNTYGPQMNPGDTRVIPRFITAALRNQPLTVHGQGKQTRSFCYIDDLVAGLIKLMESSVTGPVNLGNPQEIKIIDLAKKIIKLTNSKSKIVFAQRPPDDPNRRQPDITLAQTKLSWQPRVSLAEGLRLTRESLSERK